MVAVSVILPTYEEAATIAGVVDDVTRVLADTDYEVIVVDDSPSTDTIDALARAHDDNHRVGWIHRQGTGLSSAVIHGFDKAEGDVLVCMDADGQHPPTRVRELTRRVQAGADLAVGSRHLPGGEVAGDWPLHRRVISTGADTLARLAVPTARKLSDPMSGFFAVDSELVEAVRQRLRPSGYKILLEIVARSPVGEIYEVPFRFDQRGGGESNLGPAEYARFVQHLARLTLPARRESVRVIAGEVSDADA